MACKHVYSVHTKGTARCDKCGKPQCEHSYWNGRFGMTFRCTRSATKSGMCRAHNKKPRLP